MGIPERLLVLTMVVCLTPACVHAVLPDANIRPNHTALGIGALPGIGFSLQRDEDQKVAFGGSINVITDRHYYRYDEWGRRHLTTEDYLFDFHLLYQFLEGRGKVADRGFVPHASALVGLWGDNAGVGPELGVALTLPLEKNLTGRVNIVFGPASGIELGYHFNPQVEGTMTVFSGMGIVGVKFIF